MRPRKKDESEMNFPPEEWFAEQDTYFYPKIESLYTLLLRPDGQLFKLLKAKKVQNVKHPVQYACFLCKRWLQPDQVDEHLKGKTHSSCIQQIQHTYELITIDHEWFEFIFHHMAGRPPPISILAMHSRIGKRQSTPRPTLLPLMKHDNLPDLSKPPPPDPPVALQHFSPNTAFPSPVPFPAGAMITSPLSRPPGVMLSSPIARPPSAVIASPLARPAGSVLSSLPKPVNALPKPVPATSSSVSSSTTSTPSVLPNINTEEFDNDGLLFVRDKEADIQGFLAKNREYPFVGLEYVIEIQEKGSQEGAWYSCRLCDILYKPKVTSTCLDNMRQHLIMNSHKTKYLSKHFPTIWEYKLKTTPVTTLNEITRIVEKCFGRLKVRLLSGRKKYKDNLDEITRAIELGPHLKETQFIVDIVIKKKPEPLVHALDKKEEEKEEKEETEDKEDKEDKEKKKEKKEKNEKNESEQNGLDERSLSPISSIGSPEETTREEFTELRDEPRSQENVKDKTSNEENKTEKSAPIEEMISKEEETKVPEKANEPNKKVLEVKNENVNMTSNPTTGEDKGKDILLIKEEVTENTNKLSSAVETELTKIKSELINDKESHINIVKKASSETILPNSVKSSSLPKEETETLTPEERRLKYKKEREERVTAFLAAEKVMLDVLDKLKQTYLEDAVQHPDYSREWSNFWRGKTAELRARGISESTYDMKPEWIIKWTEYFEWDFVNRRKKERDILMRKFKLLPRDLAEFERKQPEMAESMKFLIRAKNHNEQNIISDASRKHTESKERERSASPWEEDYPNQLNKPLTQKRPLSPAAKEIGTQKRNGQDDVYSESKEGAFGQRRSKSPSSKDLKVQLAEQQRTSKPSIAGFEDNYRDHHRRRSRSPAKGQDWHSERKSSEKSHYSREKRYERRSTERSSSPRRESYSDRWSIERSSGYSHKRSPDFQRDKYSDKRSIERSPPHKSHYTKQSPISQRLADQHRSERRSKLSPFSERSRLGDHHLSNQRPDRRSFSPESEEHRGSNYLDDRIDEPSNEVSVISTLRLMSALDQAGFIRDLGKQIDEHLGKAVVLENRIPGSSWDLVDVKDFYKLLIATKDRVDNLIKTGTMSESENKVCRIILDNVIILLQRSTLKLEDVVEKKPEVIDDQRLIKMAIARTIDQQLTAQGQRLSQEEFNALVEAEYIRVKHQLPSQISQQTQVVQKPTALEQNVLSRNPWTYDISGQLNQQQDVVPQPHGSREWEGSLQFNIPKNNPLPAQGIQAVPSYPGASSVNLIPAQSPAVPIAASINQVPLLPFAANPSPILPAQSAQAIPNIDWNSLSNIIKTVKSGPETDQLVDDLSVHHENMRSEVETTAPVAKPVLEEDEFYADFTDEELISLLRNFKTLEPLEQKDLISHMKKLERDEPDRVLRLKEAVHRA